MTIVNNCRGMTLETLQRSKAPNDARRNLESHYRKKVTREIIRLLYEDNGKTMQPEEDPFQFMMEIALLATDLHRLGDRSVTELRKCVTVVAGFSADYEIEVRILKNNSTGFKRAESERVAGSQYNRFLRHQQDSKAKKTENQEMPPPTRRAEVGASATSVGMRSTLRINTVACAEACSIGLVIGRSEEPRRVQCWPKQMCQQILRWEW